MAVRIDVEAFRDSIPPAVDEIAARLLTDGNVGELESAGGGVQALVRDRGAAFQPWVGIVDGIFTGDCDCGLTGDDLCAHAVATAMTAFQAGATFSGAATPPGTAPVDPDHAHYLQAVQRLSPRQLAELVAGHAVRDRLFATLLLRGAGMLDAADTPGLADFHDVGWRRRAGRPLCHQHGHTTPSAEGVAVPGAYDRHPQPRLVPPAKGQVAGLRVGRLAGRVTRIRFVRLDPGYRRIPRECRRESI